MALDLNSGGDARIAPVELLKMAQRRRDDVAAFLQALVRIPSVNGRESESAVAERIAVEANRLGFDAELVAADPARPNILVECGSGGDGFAFIGHMDTVAEGDPAAWAHSPFGGEIDAGRLYGRGSADNKAGLACALYAMALLRDEKLIAPDEVFLTLAGVVDEESGASSPLGVRHLLDAGRLKAKGSIYTYASDIVCVGHRGLLRLIVRVEGRAIHSGSREWSRGEGGANAVTGLAAMLLGLEQLRLDAPHPGVADPAFEGLGCTITPGTLIRGGEFESMVPAHAEALIDVRLMPGQDIDAAIGAIGQVVDTEIERRPGLLASLEVKNRLPGAAIPMDHPLAQIAQHYAEAITGRAWPIAGAGPANEGYMLIGAGIPTLCGLGPEGGNAHAPDEWVRTDSLPQTVAMYAGIVREYLHDRS